MAENGRETEKDGERRRETERDREWQRVLATFAVLDGINGAVIREDPSFKDKQLSPQNILQMTQKQIQSLTNVYVTIIARGPSKSNALHHTNRPLTRSIDSPFD